jgi:thermostable 8-oxoguanine DNA glycosylase
LNTVTAANFIKSIDSQKIQAYKEYWDSITPESDAEIFRRYLFAYCSVHTTFQGNIKGYQAIKEFEEWSTDKEALRDKLRGAHCGLYNIRTDYIWDFSTKFWDKPSDFYFTSKKNHVTKRDSIVSKVNGLGFAKVSFALEMIHPNEARVLCGDIHQLRLYGMDGLKNYQSGSGLKMYKDMERHWIIASAKKKIPSYIARCIFWDELQGYDNTRYWSFVLEG